MCILWCETPYSTNRLKAGTGSHTNLLNYFIIRLRIRLVEFIRKSCSRQTLSSRKRVWIKPFTSFSFWVIRAVLFTLCMCMWRWTEIVVVWISFGIGRNERKEVRRRKSDETKILAPKQTRSVELKPKTGTSLGKPIITYLLLDVRRQARRHGDDWSEKSFDPRFWWRSARVCKCRSDFPQNSFSAPNALWTSNADVVGLGRSTRDRKRRVRPFASEKRISFKICKTTNGQKKTGEGTNDVPFKTYSSVYRLESCRWLHDRYWMNTV